ncbi:MAG: hypothetical protein EBR82_46840, partial [Caulobacteraceae bacterium]|nr:hypothetical protein [Caulobacteraceae bacterium]
MAVEAFELEIRDGISGPANEIRGAILQLRQQIKGMSLDLIENQKRQLDLKTTGQKEAAKEAGIEIAKQRLELRRLGIESKDLAQRERDLAGAQKDVGASSGVMAGLVAGAVVKIGDALLAAGRALVDFVSGMAKLAVESSSFRVHMTNAYAVFRGTATEGAKTYEMVRGLARTLPIPREQAMRSAQELMSLNLQGENRTRNTIQAVANTQAALGDEAASKLKSIITTAQATTAGGRWRGVFAPSREELVALGVSYDELSAVLAKQLGKTNAEAKAMLLQGRITAAAGIDALNATVTKGRIGEAARAALYEPGVVFQHFKDTIFDLFDGYNLRPIMEQMRLFADMFDKGSESGKALKNIMDALFGGGGASLREGLIRARLGFLDIQIAILKTLVLFAPMLKEIKKLGESQTVMDALSLSFKALALSVQIVATNLVMTADALAKIVLLVDKLRAGDTKGVGQDAVEGLIAGLQAKGDSVTAAAIGLGAHVVSGLRKGLDSHSPSKKMMLVGKDAADGFRLGAEAGGLPLGGGSLRVDVARITPAAASAAGRSVEMGGITLNV